MSSSLAKQIMESSVKELHALKALHAGTLAEAVIDQEIRLRAHAETLSKLNTDYIERKES